MGAVDWDRRLFDSLVPLPDGTTYNAYLVEGSEKTALIDAVDPDMVETLLAHLEGVDRIDYLVSQHAEQDHFGTIAVVLDLYPEAIIVTNAKSILKVEVLDPVLCKGLPQDDAFAALDRLADAIAQKHTESGFHK